MHYGLDFNEMREVIITLIMMGAALLGSLFNYCLHKAGAATAAKYSKWGVFRAIVLGIGFGFLAAWKTQGGGGLSHWEAAGMAFTAGFGVESAVGKLKGVYDKRKAKKAAAKPKDIKCECDAKGKGEEKKVDDSKPTEQEKLPVTVIDAVEEIKKEKKE